MKIYTRNRRDEMKKLDRLLRVAEDNGWTYDISDQDGKHYIEFYQYSPAGEDFSFTAWYKDANDLVEQVKEYAADFDIDEHVEMWLEGKRNGVGGVPSAVILVHDAEDIQEMLDDLAMALVAAA